MQILASCCVPSFEEFWHAEQNRNWEICFRDSLYKTNFNSWLFFSGKENYNPSSNFHSFVKAILLCFYFASHLNLSPCSYRQVPNFWAVWTHGTRKWPIVCQTAQCRCRNFDMDRTFLDIPKCTFYVVGNPLFHVETCHTQILECGVHKKLTIDAVLKKLEYANFSILLCPFF